MYKSNLQMQKWNFKCVVQILYKNKNMDMSFYWLNHVTQ